MWRGNKLFICLRAYCLMFLFENFSSFISSTFLHLKCLFLEDIVTVSHNGQVNVQPFAAAGGKTASLLNYRPWPDQLLNLIAFLIKTKLRFYKIKSV